VRQPTSRPLLEGASRPQQLALATWTFAITSLAWNLVGPLALRDADDLGLTSIERFQLVAAPVVAGSLTQLVCGGLADRYGGRSLLPVLCFGTAVPVLGMGWAGSVGSYGLLLACAVFLGLADASLAVGVPFVTAWFEPAQRGTALGIYGLGMSGLALSWVVTPRLVDAMGDVAAHLLVAGALVATGVLVLALMRDAPTWKPRPQRLIPQVAGSLRLPATWQLAFLFAVTFGGFVAFSTFLPGYLDTIYGYHATEAAARTAGFTMAAVLAWPMGGALSDRLHPKPLTLVSLLGMGVMAMVIAAKPPPEVPAGLTFVVTALFLGIGTGAVVSWIPRRALSGRVGAVAGVVAAAGGLGSTVAARHGGHLQRGGQQLLDRAAAAHLDLCRGDRLRAPHDAAGACRGGVGAASTRSVSRAGANPERDPAAGACRGGVGAASAGHWRASASRAGANPGTRAVDPQPHASRQAWTRTLLYERSRPQLGAEPCDAWGPAPTTVNRCPTLRLTRRCPTGTGVLACPSGATPTQHDHSPHRGTGVDMRPASQRHTRRRGFQPTG
jgi:NNP family nitrate/nitrite transporter-like MFS transporter